MSSRVFVAIRVEAPCERVFHVFVNDIGARWQRLLARLAWHAGASGDQGCP